MTDIIGVCDNGCMLIELVQSLDAAASELLACLKRGDASSEELLGVLSGTRAVRGKLDTVQALAAAGVGGQLTAMVTAELMCLLRGTGGVS